MACSKRRQWFAPRGKPIANALQTSKEPGQSRSTVAAQRKNENRVNTRKPNYLAKPMLHCVRARQPQTEWLLSMSEFMTRSLFMTRWRRACLGTMLLPMATLCASGAPRPVLDLVSRFEQQRAELSTG